MKIYHSETFQPSDEDTNLYVYNGLDTCLTYEIYQKLLPLLDADTSVSYRWSFASQSLALEMMFRGDGRLTLKTPSWTAWTSR